MNSRQEKKLREILKKIGFDESHSDKSDINDDIREENGNIEYLRLSLGRGGLIEANIQGRTIHIDVIGFYEGKPYFANGDENLDNFKKFKLDVEWFKERKKYLKPYRVIIECLDGISDHPMYAEL